MSSFSKNVLPRREHRERAQPASRISKHGLLEKKKDYKLRAKDHNRKRLRVKLLREKAAFRNPDEFYFGMINSVTDGGRIRRVLNTKEKDAIPIPNRDREQRLLAETQDSRYVQLKSNTERASLQKLKQRLHFTAQAASTSRTHIKFEDNDDDEKYPVPVKHDQEPAVAHRSRENPKHSKLQRFVAKQQVKAYKHIAQKNERLQKLDTVLADMQTSKNLLSKGRRFVIRPSDANTGAPAVYRWQRERRR